MSVHTLGDWHQSIIHDLCRAWYLILKALVQRVSRFWAGRPPSSAPAAQHRELLMELVIAQAVYFSPERGGEVTLGSHQGGKQRFFWGADFGARRSVAVQQLSRPAAPAKSRERSSK